MTHVDDIARYSRLVIEAAEDGDEVALRRQDAGRELGACVVAVAQRLKIAELEIPGPMAARFTPATCWRR
jgi:hypothetical protein